MIDWTARAKCVFEKNPQTPTAKTDETPISSVLSVRTEGVSEKSQQGFVGFVGTSPEVLQKNDVLTIPPDVVALFEQCVNAGLYDDDDRAALSAMFMVDADGTRRLIEAMHAEIQSCRRCRHFRRPGLSDGYCIERADLPVAYGRLHTLPEDDGAHCRAFRLGGRES